MAKKKLRSRVTEEDSRQKQKSRWSEPGQDAPGRAVHAGQQGRLRQADEQQGPGRVALTRGSARR